MSPLEATRAGAIETLSRTRTAVPLVGALAATLLVSNTAAADGRSRSALETTSWSSSDTAPQAGASRQAPAWSADVMATTLVPLSVGPELSVELPGRVLAQAHLGWMPELYGDAITAGLEDAGAIDETLGALVDGAFRGAAAWRLGIGWRPFPRAGLELGAGYLRLGMDGGATTGQITPLVPPELAEEIEEQTGNVGLALDSTIHHVMIGAGWRWLIADHLVIRASLSYLQAFDSRSKIAIESYPQLSRLAEPFVSGVMHDHYMRYVKIPVVGLAVGYRFF